MDKILSSVLTKEYVHSLWDSSALLSDVQREALASLGQLASQRRLPVEEWNVEGGDDIVEGIAHARGAGGGGSVAELFESLVIAEAAEMEGDLDDVTEHQRRLKEMLRLADAFLEKLGCVDGALQGLQDQHDAVVTKTSALHTECEKLLSEKTEMDLLASGIEERLVHYDELQSLQSTLTSPNFKVGAEMEHQGGGTT